MSEAIICKTENGELTEYCCAGVHMKLAYDIFEELPDGAVRRATVVGLHHTQHKLAELAEGTNNECYAICPATKQVVARVNVRDVSAAVLQRERRKASSAS